MHERANFAGEVPLATSIIMPALEMAQETGKLIRWLKREGDTIAKGEPVMEIETDKVTVEIEATDSGTLSSISAREGDVVPVGRTIAWILAPGESTTVENVTVRLPVKPATTVASPLARKIAEENGVDLALVRQDGRRIEKADVLAYLEKQTASLALPQTTANPTTTTRLSAASPKARRLAVEHGVDPGHVSGSGPVGAVLAANISAVITQTPMVSIASTVPEQRMKNLSAMPGV